MDAGRTENRDFLKARITCPQSRGHPLLFPPLWVRVCPLICCLWVFALAQCRDEQCTDLRETLMGDGGTWVMGDGAWNEQGKSSRLQAFCSVFWVEL